MTHDPAERVGYWKFADTLWRDLHTWQIGSIIRYQRDPKKVARAWEEVIRRRTPKGKYHLLASALYNINSDYKLDLITLPPNVIEALCLPTP